MGGISSDGTHVWVSSLGGPATAESVIELDSATGALVQVITASSYGFSEPFSLWSDGTDVWVANFGDQSVTGFPA
jgi:DNA-binding beta-propeller fold protein YncE